MQYLPSYRFDKKSYMSYRLVPISVTLNDLERQNGPILHYFTEFVSAVQEIRLWASKLKMGHVHLRTPLLGVICDP